MKRATTLYLSLAGALAAGSTLLLPACETVTCEVVGVQFANVVYQVPQGDTAFATASTITSCPDRISPDVTFSSSNPAVLAVSGVEGTVARLIGQAPGVAMVRAVSRDRPALKDSLEVTVIGPSP